MPAVPADERHPAEERAPLDPWEIAGRVLGVAAATWLQVVGVVTESILHHVVHALPVALLVVTPRGRWTRHNAALAGFAWVLMLSLLTPMIRDALRLGVHFSSRNLAYTWLAPGMLLIGAAWSSVNLALLSRAPRRLAVYFGGMIALGTVFAWVHPAVQPHFDACLEGVLRGELSRTILLGGWAIAFLLISWLVVSLLTAQPRRPMRAAAAASAAGYWIFFVACMVIGLLPALN